MTIFKRVLLLSLFLLFSATVAAASSWTDAARKVGQSEALEVRAQALSELRKIKDLEKMLLGALGTSDHHIALEAISALPLKNLVPELLKRVETDPDGFLTLALSSLLDETNKDEILNGYVKLLRSANYSKLSPASIVAQLEPLGRLGVALPSSLVAAIFSHPFPEVRAAALNYIRTMALAHSRRDYDKTAKLSLKAGEFQLRLQGISYFNELYTNDLKPPYKLDQLRSMCQKEKNKIVRNDCLQLLKKGGFQ